MIIVLLLLIAVLPAWPYIRSWGYYPSGGLGLLLVIFTGYGPADQRGQPGQILFVALKLARPVSQLAYQAFNAPGIVPPPARHAAERFGQPGIVGQFNRLAEVVGGFLAGDQHPVPMMSVD